MKTDLPSKINPHDVNVANKYPIQLYDVTTDKLWKNECDKNTDQQLESSFYG